MTSSIHPKNQDIKTLSYKYKEFGAKFFNLDTSVLLTDMYISSSLSNNVSFKFNDLLDAFCQYYSTYLGNRTRANFKQTSEPQSQYNFNIIWSDILGALLSTLPNNPYFIQTIDNSYHIKLSDIITYHKLLLDKISIIPDPLLFIVQNHPLYHGAQKLVGINNQSEDFLTSFVNLQNQESHSNSHYDLINAYTDFFTFSTLGLTYPYLTLDETLDSLEQYNSRILHSSQESNYLTPHVFSLSIRLLDANIEWLLLTLLSKLLNISSNIDPSANVTSKFNNASLSLDERRNIFLKYLLLNYLDTNLNLPSQIEIENNRKISPQQLASIRNSTHYKYIYKMFDSLIGESIAALTQSISNINKDFV